MWPTENIWGNAFLFAAVGSGLILVAALGSVLGKSDRGRKVLKIAPLVLVSIIGTYVFIATVAAQKKTAESCIYAPDHPSNC